MARGHQGRLPVRAAGRAAFLLHESDEPTSFLILFTPGAPREGYFEGVRHLATLNDEEREKFLLAHDSYFIDPRRGPGSGRDR
ncbi:hypothetical protein GCM10011581_41260 [Saccharopolyspora subtropica]|uniref:Uncharacterized protein n=1 Tax=Saccharopolyspora thermophila TaxID=89367 RepID=A0A917K6L2_9PSEU|nr:hypothetical protein GCM10011581_41260 [Saccharopolyspora subtropica]